MEPTELRDIVKNYVDIADERLLQVVKAVVETYNETEIVAYSPKGEPRTRSQYKDELPSNIQQLPGSRKTAGNRHVINLH